MTDNTETADTVTIDPAEERIKERRWKFKAALARAQLTATEWAFRRDVSKSHLYRVLDDPTESAPLTAAIDAFIAATLKEDAS